MYDAKCGRPQGGGGVLVKCGQGRGVGKGVFLRTSFMDLGRNERFGNLEVVARFLKCGKNIGARV